MTEYTREQIDEARRLADKAARGYGMEVNATNAWIDAFTEALGLTLAPEKPEPGTYITENGDPARVGRLGNGVLHLAVLHDHGVITKTIGHIESWPKLNPARMVPAEPPVLTEEEVGALFDEYAETFNWTVFDHNFSLSLRDKHQLRADITATVNAALREHGHGRAAVTREQVRSAISRGLARTGGYTYARAEDATDAVMDLLGGGDRG